MSTFGKIGATDILWKPPYDSEVEYLGSNGTSYFNLVSYPAVARTYKGGSDDEQVITFKGYLKYTYGWGTLVTLRYLPSGRSFELAEYPQLTYRYGSSQNRGVLTDAVHTFTTKYGFTGNGSSVSVDGNVILSSDSVFNHSSWSYFNVFAGYNGSAIRAGSRFYRLSIERNKEVVLDFIPVRVGQSGFLYDRANPTEGPYGNGLYPKSGAGEFVLGPDKVWGGGSQCIELSELAFYAYSPDSFWKEAA